MLNWEDAPDPEPRAHQALIRVDAAGVNYADLMRRAGGYPGPDLPAALGLEAAGTVVAIGDEVAGLSVGQRVMAMGPGGQAELVAVNGNFVFPYPETIDPVQAGGMPIVFLTAYHLLKTPRPTGAGPYRPNPGRRLGRRHRGDPARQSLGRPRHRHRLHSR